MAVEKSNIDYYEFLQISPRADQDTIHRVYRFLAARFHPDNPGSASAEKFATLKRAYEVLSDPALRAEFDAAREQQIPQDPPLSSSIDFMDSSVGELNRRLAVLAVLYFRRRTNPLLPEVSLAELETRMGFPREYLDFTTWYLQQKGYVTRADNSDFSLTASGVDFVETQRAHIPALQRLLTAGANLYPQPAEAAPRPGPRMILLPDMSLIPDRRRSSNDRRAIPHDRRGSAHDRRSMSGEAPA